MEKEITIKTDLCEDDAEILVNKLNNFLQNVGVNVSRKTENVKSMSGHICKRHSIKLEYKPYEHCSKCEHKDKNCRVWDRFQKYPKEQGGLGLCIKMGGKGS